MKTKYYVRVKQSDQTKFELYTENNSIQVDHLSNDFGPNGSSLMYAAQMDEEEALALMLSFPLVGCLNFHKTMKNPNNLTKNQLD